MDAELRIEKGIVVGSDEGSREASCRHGLDGAMASTINVLRA